MFGMLSPQQPMFAPQRNHCPSCPGGGMGGPGVMGNSAMMLMMMQMMMSLMTQLMSMMGGGYGGGMMPMSNPGFGSPGLAMGGGIPFGGLGQSTGNFLGGGIPGGGGGGFPGSPAGSIPFNSSALNGSIQGGGQGEAAVKWALSQEGISESKNPDVVRSYSRGRWEAWCAHFVSTSLEKTGGSPFGHQASVAGILAWGQKNRGHFMSTANAKANPNKLKVGDIVVWKQNGKSHVGLLTGVNKDGTFTTIEGNTSDRVARRTHKFSSNQLTGFVRPRGTFQ